MLAQTFMQLDLIDEYRININPTVLGHGKPLFAGVTRKFSLKLLEVKDVSRAALSPCAMSQNAHSEPAQYMAPPIREQSHRDGRGAAAPHCG